MRTFKSCLFLLAVAMATLSRSLTINGRMTT